MKDKKDDMLDRCLDKLEKVGKWKGAILYQSLQDEIMEFVNIIRKEREETQDIL